ncbi:MAG: aspartate kinase [Bacteroidales bacterium]|jgi:aspartate kinase|nr:aspartate kinase [Bacteroidales bacterium]MDN5350813.1 aspartate kinase [Bacteroidales bacterium]
MISKVFKFGGASVKDIESVRNLATILKKFENEQLIIVVSAMGKTTNELEKLLKAARTKDSENLQAGLNQLKIFHHHIIYGLFEPEKANNLVDDINTLFLDLENQVRRTDMPFDEHYDATVSYGELLSTRILNAFLKEQGFDMVLIDARNYIITDLRFRFAGVDWNETQIRVKQIPSTYPDKQFYLTQGFIGRAANGSTTTLGREGSDYTAAVFAACLKTPEVWIWKDVPGLLNADPKRFSNTLKINEISYAEAIELAYYGATIIHPKTIKPLQNAGIKLYVKSFLNPEIPPSRIGQPAGSIENIPSYIVKENQCLVSISARDYSFMGERMLHELFGLIDQLHIHVNLIQVSALSLSLCFDEDRNKLKPLIEDLKQNFIVRYNEKLSLFTARHYSPKLAEQLNESHTILLEQRSRSTLQVVVPELRLWQIDEWIKKP